MKNIQITKYRYIKKDRDARKVPWPWPYYDLSSYWKSLKPWDRQRKETMLCSMLKFNCLQSHNCCKHFYLILSLGGFVLYHQLSLAESLLEVEVNWTVSNSKFKQMQPNNRTHCALLVGGICALLYKALTLCRLLCKWSQVQFHQLWNPRSPLAQDPPDTSL